MKNRIIAFFVWSFVVVTSFLFYCIALLIWICTIFFDKRLYILHQFSCFWASLYLWIVPAWSVSIKGRNKIRKDTTYIMISNHQSALDILVVFRLFTHFKWLSKAEMFKVPFIGWNMVLNQYIKLKRGDKESTIKMFAKCKRAINKGNSVYIFPEGTRSKSGIIKPFKLGAFMLAKDMQIPILPIVINGTKDALPKKSLNYNGRHKITLEVLDEIPYKEFSHLSVEELSVKARDIISRQLPLPQTNSCQV